MGKINVSKFKIPIEQQVAAHSIYVWGGSGQLCKNVDEAWIRKQEARNEGGKHADAAVVSWKSVMASPYKDVARVFDCSGYISWCLMQCGALSKRTDCDGLYAKCEPTAELKDGTLLFRVNTKNPNDETHVGVYFGGKQYHSKGRLDGVTCEPFNKVYWAKFGWFESLTEDAPSPTPEPTEKKVRVVGGLVHVRSGNGPDNARVATVRRDSTFPLLGQAKENPKWYNIRYGDRTDTYISSKPKYTEVIEDA